MWTVSRYLTLSVALASCSAVALFVFILITGNAMRDIIGLLAEGSLPLGLFLDLLSLLIPYAVSFAMPLGMLIAILLIMGRLSANNEITALRAAGISVYTLALPVLFVAVLGSGLAAYINAIHAPAARASYKAILNDLVRTDPLRFIVPKTFIHDFPGYVLYVGENNDGRLEEFWLWELDKSTNSALRLLRAEEGSFSFDELNDALVLTLVDGFTELRDEDNPDNLQQMQPTLSFQSARVRLPLEQILGSANRPRTISQLSYQRLKERERQAQERLLIEDQVELREATLSEIGEIRYNISKRFAMAASVFSLALLGIPLGIKASRSETYANIGIALGITLVYYVALVVVGWTESNRALHPEFLIWLPNFSCQILGAYLLYRSNQS